MTSEDFDMVMLHLVRCPRLLEQARSANLLAEDFNQSKLRHYGYFWAAASAYYEAHRDAPSEMVLRREVSNYLQREEVVTERTRTRVELFFKTAYSVPKEELAPDYVRDNLLQEMIDELKLIPRMKKMASVDSTKELAKAFEESQRIYDSTRIVVNKPADLFTEEGFNKYTSNVKPVLTGVDFIDYATGGLRPASMVGLIAESSGGKTMVGTQFMCEQALRGRKTFGFFYEQSLAGDIAERFYGYLSGATRDEMKNRTYNEYPERVKKLLCNLTERLSEYLKVYDMSGAVKGQGNGGPTELEAILNQADKDGALPEVVAVDWLGAMEIKCQNVPPQHREKRQRIEYCLSELKQISERFGITIFVLHQIAAHAIESKTPKFKPEWTMAHECKSFGHEMDYVFTFGRKDPETSCMWFNTSKARGAPGSHRIVKMDAQLNRIYDVAESYMENKTAERDGRYFTKGRG